MLRAASNIPPDQLAPPTKPIRQDQYYFETVRPNQAATPFHKTITGKRILTIFGIAALAGIFLGATKDKKKENGQLTGPAKPVQIEL